jgi:hypothetical protein
MEGCIGNLPNLFKYLPTRLRTFSYIFTHIIYVCIKCQLVVNRHN